MAISNSQELRKGNTMHHDTIALLQECSSDCKMAIESMERIKTQVTDKQMIELINKYYEPHIKLESECREILMTAGEPDKAPNLMARASSMMQSAIKMGMNEDDTSEAAKLLTKGCNMGIQSLSSYMNEYKAADEKSRKIADRLRELETNMVGDLQPLL